MINYFSVILGRTHGAPYHGYGYVPLRLGGGGEGGGGGGGGGGGRGGGVERTSLGEWEHNNNQCHSLS